jgi:tetratricopeptide (TPR) repeat protein
MARDAATTAALRLAPDLADAHVAAADVKKIVDLDFDGALHELDIALRLNRVSAKVHSSRANLLATQGNLIPAKQEAQLALNLDPFNYQYVGELSWILYLNREYAPAIELLDEFNRRDSRYRVDWDRFYCYLKMARVPEAITLMENALTSHGPNQSISAVLAHAYALNGNIPKAHELLKTLPKDWGYYHGQWSSS